MIEIIRLAERQDLMPVTAGWRWEEWGKASGRSFEAVITRASDMIQAGGFETEFVLLDAGQPAATACLVRADMEERPELSPWLAGVYVDAPYRGRGHGVRMVRRVEEAAIGAGFRTLWLYSNTAVGLYRKLGWLDHEIVQRPGKEDTLVMRRDLAVDCGMGQPG